MKKSYWLLSLATALLTLVGCEPPATIEPTVAINPNTVNLFIGQKDTLTAVVSPEETIITLSIWETNNSKIVTIKDGVITAKSEGSALITLTTNIGTAQCIVNVQSGILSIDKESIECKVFETTQLNVTKPEHKATAKITWKSSNKTVASVDNKGNVTGLAAGEAVITASVSGCKSVECAVKVNDVPLTYDRKHLIEHFTGDQCGYCPYGMYSIVDYLETAKTPTIWVSHHAGFNQDEFTIAESLKLVSALGVSGAPAMTMNRTQQEQGQIFHPGYLPEITIKDKNKAAVSVKIQHTYNADSRKMDITVSGESSYATDGKFLLSVLIKENRLVGKQADYYYAWGDYMWKEFMHARVIRGMLTPALGDTIVMNNKAYSKTYSYTIPAEWVAENCCVVTYLTPLEKKPIINAEQVPLVVGTQGGEEYEPYGITEGAGPSENISFDSLQVKKVANNQLEFTFTSTKTMKTYAGICKQVGLVYVNTQSDVLSAGTYPIQEDNEWGTITAGYRVDEEETLGGSRLIYSLSTDLKEGIITPIHMWRMSSGEMILDKDGNISLVFTTYNGTTVSATAVYDFSPAQGDDTQGSGFQEAEQPTLQGTRGRKVVRNGQLLIEIQGVWYSALGYKVSE